tara:strand:- start:59 stop:379 length:321 start_codon:yes stop_codon:yes gene_type:complete
LDLTFFGLTLKEAPQARVAVFNNIHEIVFHGKGGYNWDTVYNMPLWLRKFTFNKIQSYYSEEAESKNNSTSKGTNFDLNSTPQPNIPKQAFQPKSTPSYVTKKSRK